MRACAILAIVAASVQAQSIHDLFGTDRFHRAYVDTNTNEVTFEPFQELDWEAKARTALPWLNLDRPTSGQIARLSTFESAGPQFRSADFRAPIDPAVNRVSYFLICATGIVSIRPVQLKGSVNFDFDASMTTVQRRSVTGTVVGKPARPATTAAFVIVGKQSDIGDVQAGAKFEKRKQAGPAVYDFIAGGHTVTWTTPSTEHESLDAESALSFRLAGQHFLLVKWNSDFCNSSYSLFAVTDVLKPIAGNDYDCDP